MRLSFSHTPRALAIVSLALLSGCHSSINNEFKNNYESSSLGEFACFIPDSPVRKEDVVITPITSLDDLKKYVAEARDLGYFPIGYSIYLNSSYYIPHNAYTPWSLAVDQAVDVGADLVLVGRFKDITPSTRIVADTYGSGWGNVSGGYSSSVYYSGNTTVYEQHLRIFTSIAFFCRKGNFDSLSYGAVVSPPSLLPDETEDSPVTCHILLVVKGSQAEKDGIRSGQRVTKINGKPIRTRKDLRGISFRAISSVEVAK